MSASAASRRRVAAIFGLTLLEVIRTQDLPAEILQDEDPSVTMPRRLGLSDVIDRQIRQYGEAVKKRRRMTDVEVADLMRLVLRRPDAREVFRRSGLILAGSDGSGPPRWVRALPPRLVYALARRRTRRRLRQLFGRRIGAFVPGPFVLEGRSLLFFKNDSGGDACAFMTGLCQGLLESVVGGETQVVHAQCQARGDDQCRWTILAEARTREREREGVGELLRGPELEAG